MIRLFAVFLIFALPACGGGADDQSAESSVFEGALCGDTRLEGQLVAPVRGTSPGCGIDEPVSITAVDGVAIEGELVVNCATARQFAAWVTNDVIPQTSRFGSPVEQIDVASAYACRRIGGSGALSQHASGNAIDVSAFTLRDGNRISLISNWGLGREGALLARLQDAACGPFTTVLGPRYNQAHRDHFHFDTYSRRRPFCR